MNLQPHTGNACPVAADALVAVDLGDGELIVDRADALAWGPGAGDEGEGRIRRYALLNVGARADAERKLAKVSARLAELEVKFHSLRG